tara:strand:- start:2065 stop:2661 length:597 start_codon:yes stop_codon:yes gene_type:complete
MVNVTCCGNQDRNTTTSRIYPDRPPHRTRNCYVSGSVGQPGVFDYMNCDGYNNACVGPGLPSNTSGSPCSACNESPHGGYCKINNKYYTSNNVSPTFSEFSVSELINHPSYLLDSNIQTNRSLLNYDRMMTNRIRELQIMGRDPLYSPPPPPTPPTPPTKTPKEETSNILLYIGIFVSLTLLISSIIAILIYKKIIII